MLWQQEQPGEWETLILGGVKPALEHAVTHGELRRNREQS